MPAHKFSKADEAIIKEAEKAKAQIPQNADLILASDLPRVLFTKFTDPTPKPEKFLSLKIDKRVKIIGERLPAKEVPQVHFVVKERFTLIPMDKREPEALLVESWLYIFTYPANVGEVVEKHPDKLSLPDRPVMSIVIVSREDEKQWRVGKGYWMNQRPMIHFGGFYAYLGKGISRAARQFLHDIQMYADHLSAQCILPNSGLWQTDMFPFMDCRKKSKL